MTTPSQLMAQPSFPEIYERFLVAPIFAPWVGAIFEEVGLGPGDRLIDIACGTGIVARTAREQFGPSARVVGVDISPDMLEVARKVEPSVDWRAGNAMDLPLQAGEIFDVAVCQQGLQFFPDRAAAVAQMRRALVPGGRVAVATWRPDDEIPLMRDLRLAAERFVGPITDARHGFGEPGPVEELLRAAGFRDIRSRTLAMTLRFGPEAPFVRLNAMPLLGMSARGKEMAEEDRKRVVEEIAAAGEVVMEGYRDGSGIPFEMRTNLTTGRA